MHSVTSPLYHFSHTDPTIQISKMADTANDMYGKFDENWKLVFYAQSTMAINSTGINKKKKKSESK